MCDTCRARQWIWVRNKTERSNSSARRQHLSGRFSRLRTHPRHARARRASSHSRREPEHGVSVHCSSALSVLSGLSNLLRRRSQNSKPPLPSLNAPRGEGSSAVQCSYPRTSSTHARSCASRPTEGRPRVTRRRTKAARLFRNKSLSCLSTGVLTDRSMCLGMGVSVRCSERLRRDASLPAARVPRAVSRVS